ncbi:hypothetical protein D3C86_1167780 [compost metagenome]
MPLVASLKHQPQRVGRRLVRQPGTVKLGHRSFECHQQHPAGTGLQGADRFGQARHQAVLSRRQRGHGNGGLALNGAESGGGVVHRHGEIRGRQRLSVRQRLQQGHRAGQLAMTADEDGVINDMASQQAQPHLHRQPGALAQTARHHHGQQGGSRKRRVDGPAALLRPRLPGGLIGQTRRQCLAIQQREREHISGNLSLKRWVGAKTIKGTHPTGSACSTAWNGVIRLIPVG